DALAKGAQEARGRRVLLASAAAAACVVSLAVAVALLKEENPTSPAPGSEGPATPANAPGSAGKKPLDPRFARSSLAPSPRGASVDDDPRIFDAGPQRDAALWLEKQNLPEDALAAWRRV